MISVYYLHQLLQSSFVIPLLFLCGANGASVERFQTGQECLTECVIVELTVPGSSAVRKYTAPLINRSGVAGGGSSATSHSKATSSEGFGLSISGLKQNRATIDFSA